MDRLPNVNILPLCRWRPSFGRRILTARAAP
jgi:hypothetical protein